MSAPVHLEGRLTATPELRFANNGNAVASFSVVTDRSFKNDAGQWESKDTSFWNCTAFGKVAENVCESCEKGTPVLVHGTMKQESYEKDGEKRTVWKVIANSVGVSLRYGIATYEKSSGQARKQDYNGEVPF